jgi:hypothetical protein
MPRQPKARKAGRPPLPKGEAKVGTLRVRVTSDELRAIEAASKVSQYTVSEWIRKDLNTMRFIEIGPESEPLDARTKSIIESWKSEGWVNYETVNIGDNRRHMRFQKKP